MSSPYDYSMVALMVGKFTWYKIQEAKAQNAETRTRIRRRSRIRVCQFFTEIHSFDIHFQKNIAFKA